MSEIKKPVKLVQASKLRRVDRSSRQRIQDLSDFPDQAGAGFVLFARMMHPAWCARVYRVLFHPAWRMIRRTTASEAMSRVTIMRMPPSTDFAPPPSPRCRGSPSSRRRRARDAVSAARAALAPCRRSQD